MEQRTPLAIASRRAQVAAPAPRSFEDMRQIADAFARSGFFKDIRDASQALTKMLAGADYGIGPMASLTQLFIVNDKVCLSASLVGSIIKRSNVYNYRVVEQTDARCDLEFFEDGGSVGHSTFTMADAARAGLSSKQTWKSYPKAMLFSRALTQGARTFCPDVFAGSIYTVEEVSGGDGAFDQHGLPLTPIATAPAEPVALPARKPLSNAAMKTLFATTGREGTLGAWLVSSGIAPDLATRKDAQGRQAGLTAAESFAAEDALIAPFPAPESPSSFDLPDDPAPETPAEAAQLAFAAVSGADVTPPAESAAPYTSSVPGAREALMAMFNSRGEALAAMFPDVPGDTRGARDERRYRFAETVLGDSAKRSSKSWTRAEYDRVYEALGKL